MAKRNQNPSQADEGKIPQAVIKQLEAVIKNEVGDFKAAFKGEFIQLSDRVDELAEQFGDGKKGEAKLLLTKKFFDTDRKEIKEVSRISPMAVESFAEAFTLDAMTSPEVQSGKVTLTAILLDNIFRLNLSARGWNRGLGMPALIEQVGAVSEEEGRMSSIEAGEK